MNNITVLSVNIQSLNSKFNQLLGLIEILQDKSLNFDVICLQESWLSEDDNYNLFNIGGYNLYKKHLEVDCSSHGGLIVYVRNSLSVTKVECITNRHTYEGISLKIKTQTNKYFKIVNIYRPPRNNYDEFIGDFIPTLAEQIKDCNEAIVTGDFNLNLLTLSNNRNTASFFDNMLNLHLFPKITFPTHFLEKSCSLIDNIFTKLSSCSQYVQTGILFSNLSDHLPTFISINAKVNKNQRPKFVTAHMSSPNSYVQLKSELELINFKNVFNMDTRADPNINYNLLQNVLKSLITKHFPLKTMRFNK